MPRNTWKQVSSSPLVIDLGKLVPLTAFTYAPDNAMTKPTMAFRYRFFVSLNGDVWLEIRTKGSSAILCIILATNDPPA